MTTEKLFKKLSEFSALSYDWNGYGAIPICENVLLQVRDFIKELSARNIIDGWAIYPTDRGTIQLEKANPYFNVEFYPDEQCELYTEKPWHFELKSKDKEKIMKIIQKNSLLTLDKKGEE